MTDMRFMSPPPETLAWWRQRDQCRRCAHYLPPIASHKDRGGERCGRVPSRIGAGAGLGRNIATYCIDARAELGGCGPKAVLFKAREGDDHA